MNRDSLHEISHDIHWYFLPTTCPRLDKSCTVTCEVRRPEMLSSLPVTRLIMYRSAPSYVQWLGVFMSGVWRICLGRLVHISPSTHTNMYKYMYVYMYIYVYIWTYIHIWGIHVRCLADLLFVLTMAFTNVSSSCQPLHRHPTHFSPILLLYPPPIRLALMKPNLPRSLYQTPS